MVLVEISRKFRKNANFFEVFDIYQPRLPKITSTKVPRTPSPKITLPYIFLDLLCARYFGIFFDLPISPHLSNFPKYSPPPISLIPILFPLYFEIRTVHPENGLSPGKKPGDVYTPFSHFFSCGPISGADPNISGGGARWGCSTFGGDAQFGSQIHISVLILLDVPKT